MSESIYDVVTTIIDLINNNADRKIIKEKVDLLLKKMDEVRSTDGIYFPCSELRDNGYYEECILVCEKRLDTSECSYNLEHIHFMLGECYYVLKQYDKAKKELQIARNDEDYIDVVDALLDRIENETK